MQGRSSPVLREPVRQGFQAGSPCGFILNGGREANPALAGLVREMFLSNDGSAYALHCLALRDGVVRSDQGNITCPTLLMVGDQDPVTPIRWQQQIAAGIANSRIRIIPNAAHMTMLESPAAFSAVLLDFLATLDL